MVILVGHTFPNHWFMDLRLMDELHKCIAPWRQKAPATADVSGEEMTLLGKDSESELL